MIKVFNNKELDQLKHGLKLAFKDIKSEFSEHLESINQNTGEIQSLYDYVAEVEHKIEKLSERIDELQMSVNPDLSHDQFSVELTHREQETFMVLYAASDDLSAKDVARRLGFTDEMVNRYVYNLITKGIPVIKQYSEGELKLKLDHKFKDLQARKNVLKIDEAISKQLLEDDML